MLVKCVCSNCGHSYLADDQMGDLACPRCDVINEGVRNPSDIPDAPMGGGGFGGGDFFEDPMVANPSWGGQSFDPQAPPPMFITNERLFKGMIFSALAGGLVAAMLGAALGALGAAIPVVAMALAGLVVGASCRYGFSGRSAPQTSGRAFFAILIACIVSFGGFLAGSWTIERLTSSRAEITRDDLNRGLRELLRKRANTEDAGQAIVLDKRISEAERLRQLTNPGLEDYLWVQQASLGQPLLAYGKLRATNGPVVRLGPDADPITLPMPATAGLLGLELILAVFLAYRGVKPK